MPLFNPPLPTVWEVNTSEVMAGAAAGTLGANNVYIYTFELFAPLTVATGIKLDVTTPAAGTADVGIYDLNGNLLVHSGATALTASAVNSIAFASTSLSAGKYMMAFTPSSAADFYFRHTGMESEMFGGYVATSTGTAGVLPGTTGTLLSATTFPAMSLIVSGGAP